MSTQATITSLEQQVECYRRLAKLAEIQHVHVEQNQTEALLEVLASRREMLDQISRLEQSIGPAKQQWGDHLGAMDAEDRLRAQALLDETRDLLEQITTADQHDVLVLQQRKLNLGRQINQAAAARQVNRTVNRSYGTVAAGGDATSRRMDIPG